MGFFFPGKCGFTEEPGQAPLQQLPAPCRTAVAGRHPRAEVAVRESRAPLPPADPAARPGPVRQGGRPAPAAIRGSAGGRCPPSQRPGNREGAREAAVERAGFLAAAAAGHRQSTSIRSPDELHGGGRPARRPGGFGQGTAAAPRGEVSPWAGGPRGAGGTRPPPSRPRRASGARKRPPSTAMNGRKGRCSACAVRGPAPPGAGGGGR